MKVLVLGGGGMIGHKFAGVFTDMFEVWTTSTGDSELVHRFSGVPKSRILTGFDALAPADIETAMERARPDVVVNAIGLIKQNERINDQELASALNVDLPRMLAARCAASDVRLVHLSTDCVYSGATGMYTEDDRPDAVDVYGRTKAEGELELGPSLIIRTSTIGRELSHAHGLLEWFLSRPPGPVPGYARAIWSGFPSVTLATILSDLLVRHPDLSGLYNLASPAIDKHQLLSWLNEAFGGMWEVEASTEPTLDRSLDGSRLAAATGIQIPTWDQMIEELRRDSGRHDELRNSR